MVLAGCAAPVFLHDSREVSPYTYFGIHTLLRPAPTDAAVSSRTYVKTFAVDIAALLRM